MRVACGVAVGSCSGLVGVAAVAVVDHKQWKGFNLQLANCLAHQVIVCNGPAAENLSREEGGRSADGGEIDGFMPYQCTLYLLGPASLSDQAGDPPLEQRKRIWVHAATRW